MSKPERELKEALAEKTYRKNLHKLLKNKYFKKGFEYAKRGKRKDEIPYSIPEKLRKILKRRSLFEQGFEQYEFTEGKLARLKERHQLEKKQKKENRKAEKAYERFRAKHKEHKHKHKHRSKRNKRHHRRRD